MTERQRQLLEKARRKLAAARALLGQGFAEDSVSRAYYSMFFVAVAFLDTEGLTFSSHSAVIGEFGKIFAKTGRIPAEYHRSLLEAQEERLGGDYEEVYELTDAEAAKHIERAEHFLRLAEERFGLV